MVDKKSNSRIHLEYIIPHKKGKSFNFAYKSSHLLKTFNFKKMIVPIKAYFIIYIFLESFQVEFVYFRIALLKNFCCIKQLKPFNQSLIFFSRNKEKHAYRSEEAYLKT